MALSSYATMHDITSSLRSWFKSVTVLFLFLLLWVKCWIYQPVHINPFPTNPGWHRQLYDGLFSSSGKSMQAASQWHLCSPLTHWLVETQVSIDVAPRVAWSQHQVDLYSRKQSIFLRNKGFFNFVNTINFDYFGFDVYQNFYVLTATTASLHSVVIGQRLTFAD